MDGVSSSIVRALSPDPPPPQPASTNDPRINAANSSVFIVHLHSGQMNLR